MGIAGFLIGLAVLRSADKSDLRVNRNINLALKPTTHTQSEK